jgi:hypothetical protein
MDELRKSLANVQIIRACMLIGIALCLALSIWLPTWNHSKRLSQIEIVAVLVSLWGLSSVFFMRRRYARAQMLLRKQPDAVQTSKRFRAVYIMMYAISFGIGEWGLLLHFRGAPILHVVPFYAIGALLMILFPPRVPRNTP